MPGPGGRLRVGLAGPGKSQSEEPVSGRLPVPVTRRVVTVTTETLRSRNNEGAASEFVNLSNQVQKLADSDTKTRNLNLNLTARRLAAAGPGLRVYPPPSELAS